MEPTNNMPPEVIQPNTEAATTPPDSGDVAPSTTTPTPAKNGGLAKKWVLLLVALLVIAGGAYAFFVLGKDKTAAPTKQAVVGTNTPTKADNKPSSITADSVIYSTRAKDTDPFSLYTRPASGGDRKLALTLSGIFNVGYYDVLGQNVVFSTDDGIYVSRDGGKSYKNVYKLDAEKIAANNQAVTSINFSTDGTKVVFAFLSGFVNDKLEGNTVSTMDLDGQHLTTLHTFKDAAGIFVYSYNTVNQQLVYATGCYFCDGGPSFPRLLDVKTNADKQLLSLDQDTQNYTGLVSSRDGQTLLYIVGTNDKDVAMEAAGPGWQGAPPYKIMSFNLGTMKSTELATFGTLHEKDAAGKYKLYNISLGFTKDTLKPFYSVDSKLNVLNGSTASLLFEANKDIRKAPYVSSSVVLADIDSSTATTYADTFYRYDTGTKKSTVIYEGDNNTQLLGVTTK